MGSERPSQTVWFERLHGKQCQLTRGNRSGRPSVFSESYDPRYIFHFDLGCEYIFDAQDGKGGVYFHVFASSDFFYTGSNFPFPYLYDFGLNSTVYCYPSPSNAGHYNMNGVRYFYVFSTGQIISKQCP